MARSADPILARRAATHVVRVLAGAGHTAYFAGGCVRDALLALHPTDFDVATDAVPPRVRALFPGTQEVGESFGVVLVPVRAGELRDLPSPPQRAGPDARAVIEVATFRSDGPYHDARRPEHVTFSDPKSDAQRRDFTINALFLDPLAPPDPAQPPLPSGSDITGRVIDYVGGLADLNARVLRAVGDPDARLKEDHLRALRAVRFTARLGFHLDPATARAITRHAGALTGVSRERVGDELRRMLGHPSAPAALELLQRLELDAPALAQPHADPPLPLVRGLPPAQHPMTMLAAWLTDRAATQNRGLLAEQIKPNVSGVRGSLCLSNDESEQLAGTLNAANDLTTWGTLSVAAKKRLAARCWFGDGITLFGVGNPASASVVRADIQQLERDGVGVWPEPLVTGDDLVALGFTPGPAFKRALEATFDAQLEGRVRDKAGALELARRLCV